VIARLVVGYLAVFAAILAALSVVAYLFVGMQYHSLLLPALSTPEGSAVYTHAMSRVLVTILAFDIPLLIVVGVAAWLLARLSIRPMLDAQDRERAFVADAAHELRSPLAAIATIAQAATHKAEPETRDALEVISRTAIDASALIADLLTLARSPAPTLLAREPVDLAAIAHDVAGEFAPRARAASIALQLEAASAIVDGDARRLRELARNLLENALRHARSRVVFACGADAGGAFLRVRDDGDGVAPELRSRLFERYASNSTSGSGLGLALAQWVARAHEGTLALEPGDGGASFVARFPVLV
jgi:two-component system, OmpR family, sensor kinase